MPTNLKSIASELDSFLGAVRPVAKPQPAVESKCAPCAATPKSESSKPGLPEPEPVDEQVKLVRKLARAAFDYVTSRLDESDGARTIGETYMLAISALSHDANVPTAKLQEAAIEFLEEIVEVARESL